ncbi:hypothetical protein BAUCODRAFT_126370 [Baudoinia panamericana UAMH 10762]|uniref:DNA replication checkpoint mediator MRC1 domain-containing protein n=1 Tax=Baudoinia panamericana (strain UAMH 10762) TaxID=717646 RepID=M2N174_BAUPA|nr:uncharacterized protein BAUCODRAFT_126370 [Baudoinia panamericana UAMH 10762]EMC92385.1 hypothetical protein BAUCODRAFT_126370 [Baudoinia panamericana UAMH 10762]
MLTPRSKVARMLAQIDEAPSPEPKSPRASNAPTDLANVASISPEAQVQFGSGDDDEPIRAPQGRAARRMLRMRSASPRSDIDDPRPMPSSPPMRQEITPFQKDANDEDLYGATPLKGEHRSAWLHGVSPASTQSALFVSPAKSNGRCDTGEELPSKPVSLGSKDKLAQLVVQKRGERLRREAGERERTFGPEAIKESQKRQRSSSVELPEEVLGTEQHETNPEIERIMSDAARPTRKASKRALLEMERETQRLARQQALAHQMKVKKKFTTADLLARFSTRQPAVGISVQGVDSVEVVTSGASTASSAPNSDAVESPFKEPVSTPPSSPPTAGPTPLDKQKAIVERGALSKLMPVREDSIASLAAIVNGEYEDLPDMVDVLRATQLSRKAATVEKDLSSPTKQIEFSKKGLQLAWFGKRALPAQQYDSSDDELEIVNKLPTHLRAFEKARPANKERSADSKAIHTLRHLSHIGAYEARPGKLGKGKARPSMAPKVLEADLRRKAKEQARIQQQERIAELKAKGVIIQTNEEREHDQEAFENLLDKAREQALKLREAEKLRASDKTDGAIVAVDEMNITISDDEEEDEEYRGSSDEEEESKPDEENDAEDGNDLLDEAAGEANDDNDDEDDDDDDDNDSLEGVDVGEDHSKAENEQLNQDPAIRKPRQGRIILDDEDENDAVDTEWTAAQDLVKSNAPATGDNGEDPFAAFGFAANGGSDHTLMSPTQAFQATMRTPTQATQDDSFDILRKIAPPTWSTLAPTLPAVCEDTQQEESQISVVPGSQVVDSHRINLAWDTQPPETPTTATLQRGDSGLTETPGWEPTQDPGLPSPWSALRRSSTTIGKLPEHETQSTVPLRITESPAGVASTAPAPRRGKLVRRQAAVLVDSSEDEGPPVPLKVATKDAWREMARRRRETLTAAERTEVEQEMKNMMEEQAEESEDEYAGLGGDDFVAPETEEDREMIDSNHVEVDERQLARLFAERERQREEEETSRLYKDLTTGALRRKQANAWGLEEDEDEIAVRRRQMRQMEEARKRKLLLQDDNIAGLAQGKNSRGKDAFLKAIADDDDRDEVLDLSDDAEDEPTQATQVESQEATQQAPATVPLQEVSGNKRRFAEIEGYGDTRPPAKQRRTQATAFRKPASILEVRESLSFLLDEPHAQHGDSTEGLNSEPGNDKAGSDSESVDDDDDLVELERSRHNDGGFAPNPSDFDARAMPPPRLPASRRRTSAPVDKAVIDRLIVKRSSSTASESALGRTAWAAPASGEGFKVPSLLRRATTSASTVAGNDRGVTYGSNGLAKEGGGVKMGGSKKSSLAYQARAEERQAIVEASARRREENTAKIAQMRRNSSMLGKGLTGRFE